MTQGTNGRTLLDQINRVRKERDHCVAVIMFAVEELDRAEASLFLEAWVQGDWDTIAEEWPEFKDLENHP